MVSLKYLLLGSSTTLAFPFNNTELTELTLQARAGTASSSGTHDGYYYDFWNDGGGTVNYQNGNGGSYSVEWEKCGNFVGGKGWQHGSSTRTISYSASFNSNGNAYLAIYGWTTNPLVEYYIIESYGTYNPSSAAQKIMGNVTSDGATYTIAKNTLYNSPSIIGTATYSQYFSVRSSKRVEGSVNVGNHFDAWAEKGMKLGEHDFQVVAVEGYKSSGSASINVL